jgi:superfamily II DNA or RNA helicase
VNWEDEANSSFRAQLARLFDRTPATDAGALIDLVIIDEAHYLRNPSTASNRLARLLRETARHLLLLTATPVQLQSDNLYRCCGSSIPTSFLIVSSSMRSCRQIVP